MITSSRWRALGTTASVFVAEPGAIVGARHLLEAELDRIDLACSRFRDDSELMRVNEAAGEEVEVGDLLIEAIEVALRVARATDGAVDPTVGRAIRNLGYDRDFDELAADGAPPAQLPPTPGWTEREARSPSQDAFESRPALSSTWARPPKRWPLTAPQGG